MKYIYIYIPIRIYNKVYGIDPQFEIGGVHTKF